MPPVQQTNQFKPARQMKGGPMGRKESDAEPAGRGGPGMNSIQGHQMMMRPTAAFGGNAQISNN